MWEKTYTQIFKNIYRTHLWDIVTNINSWTEWHEDLDSCSLEGRFEVGNHFFLQPKGASRVKILLTAIHEGYSFTDSCSFFGATMHATHNLEDTSEGVKLTTTIRVTGPLSWLWITLVAQNIVASLPQEMEALIQYVQSKHA